MPSEGTLPESIRDALTVLPKGPCSRQDLRHMGPTDALGPLMILPDDAESPDVEQVVEWYDHGFDALPDRRDIRGLLLLSPFGAYRVRFDEDRSTWTVVDVEEWGTSGSMATGLKQLYE